MKDRFVTIVGFKNYFDIRPFSIGTLLTCEKEPDNVFDGEAIKVVFPVLGTVGYIANSVGTKANGTLSAGRIYDQVGETFWVRVMFTTQTKVIARIEAPSAQESPPPQGVAADGEQA